MILLTADWHLDDNPANEYRWEAFKHVDVARAEYGITQTYILGDLVDRKDRFTGAFVNRLLAELIGIAPVIVLLGNHDAALRRPHYFEFLSGEVLHDVDYAIQPWDIFRSDVPRRVGPLLLLPFTANPTEDWAKLRLGDYRAIFMHQTVTGARVDNGIVLENPSFPPLPRHVKVYSGDIHHPQTVGTVTYVGAPHPVKFGDDYRCRMLVLDEQTFDVVHEIELSPPRKLLLEIRHLGDLAKVKARPGDQVRLRLSGVVDDLSATEAAIAAWAKANGVTLAGTEVVVETSQAHGVDTTQSPETILRQFAAHEGLADDVLAVGLELLKESNNG